MCFSTEAVGVSPNCGTKAVDKSLNKPAKAHACWVGRVCLKKRQLIEADLAHSLSQRALDLRLFLSFYALS